MQSGSVLMARMHIGDESSCVFYQLPVPDASCLYITGQPSTEYVSEETPMAAYANVHMVLEKMRLRAQCVVNGSPPPPGDDDGNEPEPPRVLILGPENSGKTSVCKILANYAIRAGQDWEPVYVNVDPSEVSWRYVYARL